MKIKLILFCVAACAGFTAFAALHAEGKSLRRDADEPPVSQDEEKRPQSRSDEAAQDPARRVTPVSANAASGLRCQYLITVADDFIVDVYKNGKLIPDDERELILERFGATGEKIHVTVQNGDWLVFHVVSDRLRWDGSKYFAVAGCFAENKFGFVSDPASGEWSVCDDPVKSRAFIHRRDAGRKSQAQSIETPWGEGDQYIREFSGKDFPGKSLWGRASSTWIKFVAEGPEPEEGGHGPAVNNSPAPGAPTQVAPIVTPAPAVPLPMQLKRWPVQILSAIYGTGGKDADVTAKVKEHVETYHRSFSANPTDLGADPNPYWNKGLHIIYMKDGVRREQQRNENEDILPESFYGPQDAGELRAWLPESRWFGDQADIQFHADQTFTSPGDSGVHRWEAVGASQMRLIWSEDRTAVMTFDYTWSSFSEAGNAKNVFHAQK